jgi:hypothetical protein
MKAKIQFLVLAIAGLMVAACDSSSSDPKLEGVKMQMKAVASSSTISGKTSATGLTFTEVRLGVEELEFETDLEDSEEDNSGEDDSEKVEFEGPYTVDLINGTSNPNFGLTDVAGGVYDEIEIDVEPVMEDGNSIFIRFTYEGKTYEFSTTEDLEIEIEDLAGYTVDENTLTNMLVLINLDSLFAGIDLSTAVADEDGVTRINETSNEDIADNILDQFEDSCDAGEDSDDDDDLDDDDDSNDDN